ncbi:MAG: cobalamin biosynthesis protein CbiG [Alphaproteobacteria bacterium]
METGPLFTAWVMADWSAAAVPRQGKDSIWVGARVQGQGMRLENLPTRAAARARLAQIFRQLTASGHRVLAGFDFPFGYPRGTARALGLSGAPWRAMWDLLAAEIEDRPDNVNNRFDVAAGLNRRLPGAAGPFWGHPRGRNYAPRLEPGRPRPGLLPERRHADAAVPRAQPVWKLYGNGAVGSQTLTGIPVLHFLRFRAPTAGVTRVWPFETGLAAPEGPRIVLAEIYPGLWPLRPNRHRVKDAAQVASVAARLHRLDREGRLAAAFAAPGLGPAARRDVTREEAWILGAGMRTAG